MTEEIHMDEFFGGLRFASPYLPPEFSELT